MTIYPAKIWIICTLLLPTQFGLGQKFVRDIIPIFRNITIQEGLTNNEVQEITQDESGFIWLATGSGIDRYDGYIVRPFVPSVSNEDGLEKISWRPMNLIIDDSGRYILGSDFAGLQIYDPLTKQLSHFNQSNSALPDDGIRNMAADWNGNIWVATNGGICRLNPASKAMDIPHQIDYAINDIAIGADSTIWIAPSDQGLIRVKKGLIQYQYIESLKKLTIHDIFIIDSDSLLLAADSGAFLYTIKKDAIQPIFINQPGIRYSTVHLDRYKNIWSGTYNHGLLYYNSNEQRSYHFRHETGNNQSLVSDHIACLFEDHQGNMWIGSYGDGVSIISTNLPQVKVHYQKNRTAFDGNSINQVIQSSQGEVWYHNNHSLIQIVESNQFNREYTFVTERTCKNQIVAITSFQDGLLVATACGIAKWTPANPGQLTPVLTNFPQLPQTQILSLNYQYPEVFVGTSITGPSEGLWVVNLKEETIQQFRSEDNPRSLRGNQVTSTLRGTNGDLWVATWDDLNLYRPNTGFIAAESFLENCECLQGGSTVISIYEDHQGLIWFGRIDNGGLVVIDPKTLSNNCFRRENGLPDNSITTIMQDQDKNLWVGTYRGAAKIKYMENPISTKSIEVELVGKAEGLPNATLWNGATSKSKHLIYFGTRDGLIELNNSQLAFNQKAPEIILSGFNLFYSPSTSNNTPLQISYPSQMITLKPNQKVFDINFSGANFYQSGSMSYSYRFSNLDSSWINIDNQHNLTFANLAAGYYDFEVRARTTNSQWGPAQSMHIRIIPPFYQRWWFTSLLIVVALWFVYAIQQYRIFQLKKVQQIREQISHDLHDDIGSALSNIEIMSGMATRTRSPGPGIYQQILETAKNSNESLHQIVWNMNPANDKLKNILPYLSGYAARSLESMGVSLEIRDEGVTDEIKMDLLRRKDLYLCFKEAITNIIKHSKATQVMLSFHLDHKMLRVLISDNGVGMNLNTTTKGNGMNNMKDRLERWDGQVQFSQGDEEGLTLTLTMPIP